jgi:deoxyribose-phosphate aldolase
VGASRCGVSATAKIMEEAEARYAAGTLVEVTELTEMGGGY